MLTYLSSLGFACSIVEAEVNDPWLVESRGFLRSELVMGKVTLNSNKKFLNWPLITYNHLSNFSAASSRLSMELREFRQLYVSYLSHRTHPELWFLWMSFEHQDGWLEVRWIDCADSKDLYAISLHMDLAQEWRGAIMFRSTIASIHYFYWGFLLSIRAIV
jgi:hypothetical protein